MPPLSAMNAEPKIATGVSLESSSIDHREPTEAPLPAYSSSLWSSSGKAPYNAPVLQSPPRRPDPVLRRFNRACVAALVLWLLIHLVGDFWKNASGFQVFVLHCPADFLSDQLQSSVVRLLETRAQKFSLLWKATSYWDILSRHSSKS